MLTFDLNAVIPIQELSIQQIDLVQRVPKLFEMSRQEVEKKSLPEIIKFIVGLYNETIKDIEQDKYIAYPYEAHEQAIYRLRVYTQIKKRKTRLATTLESGSQQSLPKKTDVTYLFFFYRTVPQNEIVAVTWVKPIMSFVNASITAIL